MNPNPSLPEQNIALKSLLKLCHNRSYAAKSVIIRPGDVGDKLYYIVEGSVSVCMEEEDGHELVLAYLNKGDFIGEVGIFKGEDKREVMVKTRTYCQLAEISYNRLLISLKKELADCATDLLFLFGEQLASRLLHASRKVRHLAFMDVEGRIARTLLDLCSEPDAMTHPDGMQIRITRQEIGRLVGCSREMAGRVLKELEEKGLITAKGKTIVVFGAR